MRFPVGTIMRIKLNMRWDIDTKDRLCQITNAFQYQGKNEYSVILFPKDRNDEVDVLNKKGLFIEVQDVEPAFGTAKVLFGDSGK